MQRKEYQITEKAYSDAYINADLMRTLMRI